MFDAAASPSSSSFPIYVDFPGVPSSSRHRPPKKSLLDYLVPGGNPQDVVDEVAAILSGSGRPVKSAATEVERLRVVKSDAEIKVMRRTADISSNAHAKVR